MPGAVSAQSISLADVIIETFANNPDIPLSRLNRDFAKTEQQRIEGMLDPNLSTRIGYSDEKVTTPNPFAANNTQLGQLSGSIAQPLSDGSTLTGSLNYNRTMLGYPSSVPAAFQSSINPIYQNQIDLTYRYPLLRGHGNPAYHEQMAASRQDEEAALWRVEMLKEQLAEQATAAYFQLAADDLALKLAGDAVHRAEKLLQYQKMREQFGLIERSDRLQTEALLATRRMELTLAEATSMQGRTNLNRLMLRTPDAPLVPDMNKGLFSAEEAEEMSLDELLAEAEKVRPAFRAVEASLAASNARLAAARDQHETQIDLVGQLGSRALDASAGKTLGQGFTLNDRFVSLSVELSDTLTGNTTRASIRQAELGRQQAMLERLQLRESVKSRLANSITTVNSSRKTVAAAIQRARAEKNKFNAEMNRYRNGRSDTATLIQFEGELRAAELQAAIQQVSLILARHQLALARGAMLPALEAGNPGIAKP
ncbi:MAG: TolC family protein [Mariprofundaceae bacterium]|nr:TolC family protein [Mariprofundaceae bacterium]